MSLANEFNYAGLNSMHALIHGFDFEFAHVVNQSHDDSIMGSSSMKEIEAGTFSI